LISLLIKPKEKKAPISAPSGFGLSMSKQEIELENLYNEEVIRLLEASIIKSGFVIPDKIPEIILKIREKTVAFGRVNTKTIFDGEDFLTVDEKKRLGLNTRMKYSKKFIEYFEPSAFKVIEPKSFVSCVHLDAYHRVSRKKELINLAKIGVEKVKIIPDHDCAKIKRLKKVHNISEVPDLPLDGCDQPFCICYYQGIIPR
ncbi:MAG: hypothetical protein ACXV7F_09720, partial [Methylomonas sp.]